MATLHPPAVPAAECRLLQLPGEIRNRIYQYTAAPTNLRLVPPSPNNTLLWNQLARNALGLTQTCRQIRDEFLPLYQQNVTITVAGRDTDQYIADFIPEPKTAPRTIVIDAHPPGQRIDILGLIRLMDAAPKLSLHFNTSENGEKKRLRQLVSSNKNGRWRRYARYLVTEVCYLTGPSPALTMTVVRPASEHWMPWDKDTVESKALAVKWMKRVGLGDRLSLSRVDVVPVSNRYLLGDEELE